MGSENSLASPVTQPAELKRALGLPQIVLYGAGTILGAGIYVLVGEVAGASGYLAPLAFVVAGVIVAFSAYSFALLSRMFPVSAGPAAYVQEAFGKQWLATLVGYCIIGAGVISSATIARGFIGYLGFFANFPQWLLVLVFITFITLIALRGVEVSVGLAVLVTLVEIAGLCLVTLSAAPHFGEVWDNLPDFFVPADVMDLKGVAIGAFLAFYACIGFEDMVNMVEEVKNPSRNLPLGIAIVLIGTTVLYVVVTLAALVSVPMDALSESEAPLALVIAENHFMPVAVIGVISVLSITNGALIQTIMGSRVLYGMACRGLAPAALSRVHPVTRIPHRATLVVGIAVACFALALPLITLAKITSAIVLGIFTLVNLSLLTIYGREGRLGFWSTVLPGAGAILCLLFIGLQWLA